MILLTGIFEGRPASLGAIDPGPWKNHRPMDLGLRDRACIVTGASGGIGRATAMTLAGEGAVVLLVGRGGEALADVEAH